MTKQNKEYDIAFKALFSDMKEHPEDYEDFWNAHGLSTLKD